MKAYTDLEQSKKLTEFLPLESADMAYWKKSYRPNDYAIMARHTKELQEGFASKGIEYIPCWSLAALLDSIPATCDDGRHCLALINSNPNGDVEWLCCYEDYIGHLMMGCYGTNQVDACYELVLKLHKQKLL